MKNYDSSKRILVTGGAGFRSVSSPGSTEFLSGAKPEGWYVVDSCTVCRIFVDILC